VTCSIDIWEQYYLQAAVNNYQEITQSGEGVRIWGLADGDPLNRKFNLKINNKNVAVELFRRTNKALTITGCTLDPAIRQLQNVDKLFDWALAWGERRKAAAAQEKVASKGNGFDSRGCRYSIDEIEQFVREGAPPGTNRSDVFHAIIGHYVGCGWDLKRILAHLEQHSEGIGSRYLAEGHSGIDRRSAEVCEMNAASRKAAQQGTPEQRNRHSRISRQRMNPRIQSSTMITMMISARSCRNTTPACRDSMPTAIPTCGRSNPG
jgi:hypothetical protein